MGNSSAWEDREAKPQALGSFEHWKFPTIIVYLIIIFINYSTVLSSRIGTHVMN